MLLLGLRSQLPLLVQYRDPKYDRYHIYRELGFGLAKVML